MINDFKFLKETIREVRWVSVYFYPLEFIVLTDMEELQINYTCSWLGLQYPTNTYEDFIDDIQRDLRSVFDDVQYRGATYTGKTRQ